MSLPFIIHRSSFTIPPLDNLNSTHMKRRGFSLIELLVVIGLIALLGTLTVIGIAKLQTHGKQQQTRLILQNLQNMFAEYDSNRRVPFGAGNLSPLIIQNSNLANYVYLPAPGNVTTVGSDRQGILVLYTQFFVAQLMTVPNNAATIGKLPSSAVMSFRGGSIIQGSGPPSPWAQGTKYALYQDQDLTNGIQSGIVTYKDPSTGTTNVYLRSHLNTDQSGIIQADGPQDGPPNAYFWTPGQNNFISVTGQLPSTSPVLLDAWGNPIIFVMGGVLGAPPSSINVTSGYMSVGGRSFQAHSPDYRPFFASAGPDGDFSKGDDNLYSYEK